MNHPNRKPGIKLVTDRLQASRIGAPKRKPDTRPLQGNSLIDEVIAEAEEIAASAAKREQSA
jgi:hypothetical protein